MNNTTKADVLASAVLTIFLSLLSLCSIGTRFFLPLAALTILMVIVTFVVTAKAMESNA